MHQCSDDHHIMIQDFQKRFIISLILTIPILLISPMVQQFFGTREIQHQYFILVGLSSAVFFYGGHPFLKGLYDEIVDRTPGMMTLIGLAISIAYIYSVAVSLGLKGKFLFWELVTLIDIMLFGHIIEMKSVLGASKALEKLATLIPDTVHLLLSSGKTKDIAITSLKIKDKILVKPGEKIPSDGIIIGGESHIDESLLTGESNPIFKTKNHKVIGGSVNNEGSLTIIIEKIGKETFLSNMVTLVKQAQMSKSKTQNLANKAAKWLTIIAITTGTMTLLYWIGLIKESFSFAIERTVTVMVITCPHALGLAVPLVAAVSTNLAAQNGFLIRNRTAFESIRNLQAIVFDKTGTLTEGKFGVTDIISFNYKYKKEDILKYAASLETHSEHPIAKGILKKARPHFKVTKFKAIPGQGIQGIINKKTVQILKPGTKNKIINKLIDQGKTVVLIYIDQKLSGCIALSDIIRKESKYVVSELRKMGIKCMILTGDNKTVTSYVASETGIDDYFAEVLPEQKAQMIQNIQKQGLIVSMVGDGINDAPALAKADIGIAIGTGTDIAIEAADLILVKNNPIDVLHMIKLAKSTYNKMIQNLIWATGYNVFAIPAASGIFGIIISPALGAILMSFSTIICAINARLLRI